MDYAMKNKQLSLVIQSRAHPIRLDILSSLTNWELTAGERAAITKTSSAKHSKHLSTSTPHYLITTQRDANCPSKSIADCRATERVKIFRDLYCDVQPVQNSTTFPQQ